MKIYTVKKIFQYSETVDVEADSESEAKDKAANMDGDRAYDDHLYDCEIAGERDAEPSNQDGESSTG